MNNAKHWNVFKLNQLTIFGSFCRLAKRISIMYLFLILYNVTLYWYRIRIRDCSGFSVSRPRFQSAKENFRCLLLFSDLDIITLFVFWNTIVYFFFLDSIYKFKAFIRFLVFVNKLKVRCELAHLLLRLTIDFRFRWQEDSLFMDSSM